jgi:transposase
LGFVYKKPKAVPGRASQAAQEEFLNSISALLDGAANTGLFYIDGTHPQHNSQMDYGWIKKGQDKEVKTNTGRKRVNINGIINAHDPTDVLIDESDSINAQSTIRLLRHLEEKTDYLDKIYVVADNARYYRSRLVKEFLEGSKIKVLFLPPYSPNLNLIERLWRLLKKEVLSNRYFDKFADFRNAILSFFDHLEKYKPKLDSLMTLNFHTVG